LKISYVSQETSNLFGSLKEYIDTNRIDEPLFKAILRKMDFEREQFNKPIESFSEGQKKKVLLAKSICEQANIYIWDEPLNYIDIFSRMQIEKLINEYRLTMIFVEHDETFANEIANKEVNLDRK
jgi:lincosamide and streptogramin A transport system ATP-binding/permease protein